MKRKLCLGVNSQFELSPKEQAELFRDAGFAGTFLNYGNGVDDNEVEEFAKVLKENQMVFQSIHAPFGKMADIWGENREKAEIALHELEDCLLCCAKHEVPIMVTHAFIGFKDHTPNQRGIDRLGELVKLAEQKGVRIAFENTEGIEYLDALMEAFKGNKTVGFCWDSGHEMCYNYHQDLLKKYGDRLIATHLNDNLGIKDSDGKITWHDDLHLLPFDGIADWKNVAHRLNTVGFDGILTFELNRYSKPNRHENDKYKLLPIEIYVAEAYARACKVAALLDGK